MAKSQQAIVGIVSFVTGIVVSRVVDDMWPGIIQGLLVAIVGFMLMVLLLKWSRSNG